MRIIAIYDDAQTRANEALADQLRKLADELAGDVSPPTEEGS
jgi:molybdate transport system regulatory protein